MGRVATASAEGMETAFAEGLGPDSKVAPIVGITLIVGVVAGTDVPISGTVVVLQADRATISGNEARIRNGDGEKRMEKGASITRKVLKYGDSRWDSCAG